MITFREIAMTDPGRPPLRDIAITPLTPVESPRRASEQYDRLDWHLRNWARWMSGGELCRLSVRGGHGLEGFKHYDSEGEYDKSDRDTAIQVDAVIRDLKQMERDALNTEYLGAVWPGKPEGLGIVLVLAREQVQMGINRRGLV